MHRDTPRPRLIAKNMVTVCKKLMDGGDTALAVAREQQSPLRARRYDVGRGGKGGTDDTTGVVACARSERRGTLYGNFVDSLFALDASLARVDGVYEKIMGRATKEQAARERRAPGAGHCLVCTEWMPGTPKARIIEGLCSKRCYRACHRAIRRGLTRAEYLTKARRDRQGTDVDSAHADT